MTPSNDLLIGRLAVQRGLTSEERVRECLDLIQRNRAVGYVEDLGAVLHKRGYIREQELRALHREVAFALFVQAERLFARVCVERRLLTQDEARRLLEEQARDGYRVRLGELLIKQGRLDQATRDAIAEEQVRRQEEEQARPAEPGAAAPPPPLPPPPPPPPSSRYGAPPPAGPQAPVSLRSNSRTQPAQRGSGERSAVSTSGSTSEVFPPAPPPPPDAPPPPPPPPPAELPPESPTPEGSSPVVSPRAMASLDHDHRRYSSTSGTVQLDAAARGVIPGFELGERLGQGPLGVVYRARREQDGEQVGLKLISPALTSDPEFFAAFRKAWALAVRLEHPRVAKLHALGRAGDLIYFTQALVEGESLQDRVERGGPLTPAKALELTRELLEALAAAHALGIVHGGLGPRNVLVRDGHPVLTDLGISGAHVPGIRPAPGFTSPQLLQGQPPTMADDVYACGCLAWLALVGRAPFEDPGTSRFHAASDPREEDRAVDARLSTLIQRATQPQREERPADARAALALLEAAAPPRPSPPTRLLSRATPSQPERAAPPAEESEPAERTMILGAPPEFGELRTPPEDTVPPPPPPPPPNLAETLTLDDGEANFRTQALPAVSKVPEGGRIDLTTLDQAVPGDPILRTQALPQLELPPGLDETREEAEAPIPLPFDAAGATIPMQTLPPGEEKGAGSRRWALQDIGKDPFASLRVAETQAVPAVPRSAKDMSGKLIHGRYRVLERIGAGGMGEVWKAEHTLMKRTVALKLLADERVRNPDALGRFQREIMAMAQFQHPHVVRVFDAGTTDSGRFYMAMEYVPGRSLADVLKEQERLPLARCVRILGQALRGMAEGHKRQIVHRDLKTENLLISGDGPQETVKVLDFGIAKLLRDEEAPQSGSNVYVTTERVALGTPEYMSPEQASGTEQIDHRSDIYSLGVVAYEMLTGRLPFEADTPVGYLGKHILDPPRTFNETAPDLKLPPEVERFVLKALEKDPQDRYQSANDMLAALESLPGVVLPVDSDSDSGGHWANATVSSGFVVPESTSGSREGPVQRGKPGDSHARMIRRALLALSGVAVLLLLLIGVAFALRPPRASQRLAELEPLLTAALQDGATGKLRELLAPFTAELDDDEVEQLLRPWQAKADAVELALQRASAAQKEVDTAQAAFARALEAQDWPAANAAMEALEKRVGEARGAREAALATGLSEKAVGPAPEFDRAALGKELDRRRFEALLELASGILATRPLTLDLLESAYAKLVEAQELAPAARKDEVKKRVDRVRHLKYLELVRVALQREHDPQALSEAKQQLAEARKLEDSPEARELEEQIQRRERDRVQQSAEGELEDALNRARAAEEREDYAAALRVLDQAAEQARAADLRLPPDLPARRKALEAQRAAQEARRALPALPPAGAGREALQAALDPRLAWLEAHADARKREEVQAEVAGLRERLAAIPQIMTPPPGETKPPPDDTKPPPGETPPVETPPTETPPTETGDPEALAREGKLEEAQRSAAAAVARARAAGDPAALEAAERALLAIAGRIRGEDDLAQRYARVGDGLWIARHEVTNGDYMGFCLRRTEAVIDGKDAAALAAARALWPDGWDPYAPAEFPHALKQFKNGTGNRPVGEVSWAAANAYCEWLSSEYHGLRVRLPSEAEWIAAAGGAKQTWPWGAEFDETQAFVRGRGPVDVTKAGGTWVRDGVLHLIGNVAEWTADAWPGQPEARILKGGSFRSFKPEELTVRAREKGERGQKKPEWGFRVLLDLR